jgi:hypothetical protein
LRDTRDVKGAGLQGNAPPEIIEIIDDDNDAFRDRASGHTIHDSGGPRWIGPAAAVALVALIGYGVISSSATTGSPKAAPATTTSIARSTTTQPAPATTTTVALPPVPFYSADAPPGYAPRFAEVHGSVGYDASTQPPFDYNYRLWATPGSSAATGSWFSVESSDQAGNGLVSVQNGYRQLVGDMVVAMTSNPGGQRMAMFSPDTLHTVTINSFGWSDDELTRLISSVEVDSSGAYYTDSWFTPGHQLISNVPLWQFFQRDPEENIYFQSADLFDGGLNISVSRRAAIPPADALDSTLGRDDAFRFMYDKVIPFQVSGHSALAGTSASSGGYSQAFWNDGDVEVTVGGQLPVTRLVEFARSVRQVSADEWNALRKSIDQTSIPTDSYAAGPLSAVASGTDSAGGYWSVRVSAGVGGGPQYVQWDMSNFGINSPPDPAPHLQSFVDDKRAYVLADLPKDVAATAVLHIEPAGLPPVDAPFNDVFPEYQQAFAAYAFSEPVPFTAQIIAADSAVLATWPSP